MTEPSHNPQPSSRQEGGTGRKRPTSVWRKLRREISKTKLRIPHIWLRHRGIASNDVFFASYPRSGTTWSRFTLYEILSGQEASFHTVNAAVRGVGRHKFGARLLPGQGRLIATHEQYRHDYKKAIYLVRDVRDVLLSEFAYTRALEFFRGDLDKFLEVFLCGKISGFGPWPRHITSWLNSPIAGTDNMLVMRFEDLRQNPNEGFSRMAEFLGAKVDQERVRRAVANNLLEKMKEKEQAEPQRASVKDRFVRSGSVQAWRSKLSPAQVKFIEQHAGSLLLQLGYPLASGITESTGHLNPVLQSTTSIS